MRRARLSGFLERIEVRGRGVSVRGKSGGKRKKSVCEGSRVGKGLNL